MSMDYWLQAFDNGEGGFFSPDMIETLGEPRLITSSQELFVTRPFG